MSAPLPQLVGYIRVSTTQQTYDGQYDALAALGARPIFDDKAGGQHADRPGYVGLLKFVQPGDVIVVTSLDRLGRSLSGIVKAMDELRQRKIYVRTLRESIDTSTAVGWMLAGIFGSLAEYERTLIGERAAAARQAAHDRGRLTGRPAALSSDQIADAVALRAAGRSIPDIMRTLNAKRSTLYRALATQLPTEQG